MNNIPSEVYNIIFSYLDKKDFPQCLRVCKSWHPQANQLFWKEVTIYSRRISDLRDYLFGEDPDQYFKYGHLTRKIIFEPPSKPYEEVFDFESEESDSEEEYDSFSFQNIQQLMSYFPNVEEIRIANELYREYLLRFLEVDLKCIKKIANITHSVIFDYMSYDIYIALCFKYSDTMTNLDFKYTPESRIRGNQIVSISTLLSPFKNLAELTLRNDFDIILTTINIQAICPNLTEFTYQSKLPVIDMIVEKQVEILTDTEMYHINRNINKLYLTLPNFPVNFVKYLTKYLPDKMEKIYLNITDTCLYSWIDEVGEETALKFMEKLRGVKVIAIFFSKEDTDQVYSDTNESRMTRYFKLVNAFKGDRKTYCTFKADEILRLNSSFSLNINGNLELGYGLDINKDFFKEVDANGNTDEESCFTGFNSADTTISGIGLESVDEMHFEYDHDDESVIPFLVFDYVLKNCPNINEFEIVNRNLPYPAIQADSNLSRILNTDVEGFSSVRMTNVAYYPELINTLTTHLPNVYRMSCEYDISYDYVERFDTDLSDFTNLREFLFDVKLAICDGVQYLIINFEYTDGEEKQYCFDVAKDKLTALEKNFDFGTNVTDTITFKCNKNLKFILRSNYEFVIGALINGELLDVNYPILDTLFYFPE